MSKNFSFGTRVRDVLRRSGVVIGCVDDLVVVVMDEPSRYDNGQRMVSESLRQHLYHEDDYEELGEWESVSRDMWLDTLPPSTSWDSTDEDHRERLNNAIRMVAPDAGKERKE